MRRWRCEDNRAKSDTAFRIEANEDRSHGIKVIKMFGETAWIFSMITAPLSALRDNMKMWAGL